MESLTKDPLVSVDIVSNWQNNRRLEPIKRYLLEQMTRTSNKPAQAAKLDVSDPEAQKLSW
jgi:hypothetical protein